MEDRLISRNHVKIHHWPITALRVYTGIFFAFNGFRKLFNDGFPNGMVGFLKHNAESSPAFYQAFVEAIVPPMTRAAYRSDISIFQGWCEAGGVAAVRRRNSP